MKDRLHEEKFTLYTTSQEWWYVTALLHDASGN